MKTKIITLLISVILLANARLLAQPGLHWSVIGNNLTSTAVLGTTTNYSVVFKTNNVERGRLAADGLWGFGSIFPNAKVHINSAAGQTPLRVQTAGVTKLLVNSAGNVGIGTTVPQSSLHVVGAEVLSTGFQAGFKFRNRGSATAADDWAWYSDSKVARLWQAGYGDVMGITTAGNVGIGTTAPDNYRLRIKHGSYGLDLQQVSTGNHWEIYTAPAPNNFLGLYYNSVFKGSFSTTGAYTSVSDARLKTNIQPMPTVLDKINQLKPATYQFKTSGNQAANSTPEYGFIAQEVQKVFPHLVMHNVDKERQLDAYTVDYSGFGVLAIKGLQELQQTIQEQQKINHTLLDRIAKLEAIINAGGASNGSHPTVGGVSLEQNQPNPFNQTTTFRYTIPPGANAQIMIYDAMSGSLLKSVPAPATGQAELNGHDLKAGTYIYSLVVNGKQVDSKKMVLSK